MCVRHTNTTVRPAGSIRVDPRAALHESADWDGFRSAEYGREVADAALRDHRGRPERRFRFVRHGARTLCAGRIRAEGPLHDSGGHALRAVRRSADHGQGRGKAGAILPKVPSTGVRRLSRADRMRLLLDMEHGFPAGRTPDVEVSRCSAPLFLGGG